MVLEVLTYPDPRLRQKGQPVGEITAELKEFAESMVETMYESNGIGLASTQVGRSIRFVVVDTRHQDEDGNYIDDDMTELEKAIVQPLLIFNPQIVKSEGKQTFEEGCLSVPTFYEMVERFNYIELKYVDINGKEQTLKTDGTLSVCIQHEMDHLDGKLFIDRLSNLKSSRIKKRIEKSGYPTPEEAREERDRVRAARKAAAAEKAEASS
jgi:peptide deformylase